MIFFFRKWEGVNAFYWMDIKIRINKINLEPGNHPKDNKGTTRKVFLNLLMLQHHFPNKIISVGIIRQKISYDLLKPAKNNTRKYSI